MGKKSISSEQAFDMLPYVVDIYDKLDFDKYRKELQKKYAGKKSVDSLSVGLEATKFIIRNAGKVKDEFFAIVAIAENTTIEEAKKQPFVKTVQTFKEIITDPELMDFFKQATQ